MDLLGKDEQEQIEDKGAKKGKVFAKHKLKVNMATNPFVLNLILILFSFKSHCVHGVCKYMQQKSDHLFLGSPVLKPGKGAISKAFPRCRGIQDLDSILETHHAYAT